MGEPLLNINVPVSYSPLKHHLSHQLNFIRHASHANPESLIDEMVIIGNNAIDVYCGRIPVHELYIEILKILADHDVYIREELILWLGSRGYREVIVNDGSKWVIRLSENEEKFVHIHPGKMSLNTFRLRGTTLKTAMTLCILFGNRSESFVPSITLVNSVRRDNLGLSPVKSLSESTNILKWFFFYRQYLLAGTDL